MKRPLSLLAARHRRNRQIAADQRRHNHPRDDPSRNMRRSRKLQITPPTTAPIHSAKAKRICLFFAFVHMGTLPLSLHLFVRCYFQCGFCCASAQFHGADVRPKNDFEQNFHFFLDTPAIRCILIANPRFPNAVSRTTGLLFHLFREPPDGARRQGAGTPIPCEQAAQRLVTPIQVIRSGIPPLHGKRTCITYRCSCE